MRAATDRSKFRFVFGGGQQQMDAAMMGASQMSPGRDGDVKEDLCMDGDELGGGSIIHCFPGFPGFRGRGC